MTIVGSHKEITVPYGVLNMGDGSLIGIDEKPKDRLVCEYRHLYF